MRIEVISNVNEARADRITHRTAIVIDVLRATSTIVAALEAGSAGILPVETVLEARTLQRPSDLLAGERFCRKIAGFDLGNSPPDFIPETVKNRRIILTTTNGTRAMQKALRADTVLAGSLTNGSACAKAAIDFRRDIVLICSGSHDEFALEDGLCAGFIIDRLLAFASTNVEIDDFGTAMLGYYRNTAGRITDALLGSTTGRRLVKMGYARDIDHCAKSDCCAVVPKLQGDTLVLG
ncbi:2-phosphosulfolactate phosphatase [Paenibacillus spongiae]|uniref:Probable 2-phosphosulfolactate phosphatase n=1 Tax=Paenibacillus spongiae TaxID=2909671 RepID=A0ABY5SF49_9BACL|nr:2-phosphosulfolactate phosphatase [Paenibacillus spongiae]UVI32279.1 2-phosphosulfolactate phosphatase [Paenibacillus spongiae]